MPASPNATTAGRGTSTIVSAAADVHPFSLRSTPLAGISTDYRSWTLVALVLVIALLLRFSIAATLPLVEPTEGRYAQISQEMASQGDWVTPRLWINGEHIPFLGKPPLFFWSAALSIKIFGANELAVRLPSLIAAAALLILMYGVVGCYFGRKTALNATAITLSCPLFFGAAGTVILDLHLTFFVAGALLAYLAFALEHDPGIQRRWSLAIFVLLAGGFLTKGPVALVLFGLPVFLWTVLRRKWRLLGRHAWSTGIPVFLLLVAPWFILAELRNPGFLHYFFVNENLLRYLSPDYGDLYGTGHRVPRGAAVLMFLVACLPWTPVAGWLLLKRRGSEIRRVFTDDVSLFLFLGFAANVIFWCFARQLLGTYLLPTIPLFAVWAVRSLGADHSNNAWRPQLFTLAVGTAAIWALAIVFIGPLTSKDSARSVLAEATKIARRQRIPGRIVFVGRTPYSAIFYDANAVSMHQNQPMESTLDDAFAADESRLLILRESDIERVPADLREYLRPTSTDDQWTFLVTPNGRGPAFDSSSKNR